MKHQIFRLINLLLLSLLLLVCPISSVLPVSPVSANDPLEKKLKELIVGVQEKIEQAEPVFHDHYFQQWARMVFGIRHMTYIVDTRDPEKTLGIVTFTCKVTQSDFFLTKEEAAQAPIKNMVPKLIPCRATYQWKADSWEYASGALYARGGEWQPIATDKPDAFPQVYFDLMRGPANKEYGPQNKQNQQEQETTQEQSPTESIAEVSAP